MPADVGEQFQLPFKVDSPYLYLDAAESRLHFLLNAAEHFLEVSHPDEAVDGDSCLAFGKGRLVKAQTSRFQMQQGSLQAEEHGRVGTKQAVVDAPFCLEVAAKFAKDLFIVCKSIAAQVGQGSALSHAGMSRFHFSEPQIPHLAGAVYTA